MNSVAVACAMAEGVGVALALFQSFGSIVSSIEMKIIDMDQNSDAFLDCLRDIKFLTSKINELQSMFDNNLCLHEDENLGLLLRHINELLRYIDAKLEKISKKKQI